MDHEVLILQGAEAGLHKVVSRTDVRGAILNCPRECRIAIQEKVVV
jgi:hypothetical protein